MGRDSGSDVKSARGVPPGEYAEGAVVRGKKQSRKITIVQGDPGDGKSTMMINLIAELSKGGVLPDDTALNIPRRIIYQCSEDGAMDTIKPRHEKCDAECGNIAFITEDFHAGISKREDRGI